MTPPQASDLIRTAVLVLLAGIAIPVLVQLFLTLRAFQRSTTALERKLDQALAAVAVGRSGGSDSLALLAAAVAPAVIAGFRAYRAGISGSERDGDGAPPPAERP